MKHFRSTLLLALSSLLSGSAWAQTATGSLSGTIIDQNGAAVPGAKVSARNEATGVELQTQSSEAGLYVFPTVPVGVYSVVAEKTGFKKTTRSGLEIRIASRQEQEITMEVGDVQQSVEVTASAQLLETTSSQKGENISPNLMNNLPLFTGGIRDPRSFIRFMPGVNSSGLPETSISGSGGRAAEILVDGASLTIPESGGTSFNFPAMEMFGEFKLLTGTYDAEYGRFGGGVQIFVTKSGTNDLHGSAFLNLRRDIWNANAWARNATGQPRSKERFNEVGGSLGGPVWIPKVYDGRNKTFWFFTYSKDQRPVAILSNPVSTVPTALMKQGNFSELPASQVIYDPATTSGDTRQPFPNQIIPQTRWSAISRNLVSAIPNPTRPGITNNYDFVNTQGVDRYIWNIKLDHAFTPNNRLAFTLTKEDGFTDDTNFFPGPLGQGIKNFQRPDNWRFNHDLVIRPTILLHTVVGYSRQRQIWDNPNQDGAGSRFGFPGLTGDSDAMPRVQFTGADAFTNWGVQDGKVANGSQVNKTLQIAQGLSIIHGKHEFKMGWDYRRLSTRGEDLAGTNGLYSFARAQTALPTNLAGTGNAFASLLLGLPDVANRTALPVLFGTARYYYTAGYFQDNWKVNSRLTLNLGMRYEVPINWHEENGDYSGMNRTLPNSAAGNIPGALEWAGNGAGRTGETRFYKTDFSNIGPRVGFTYRLFDKTVLRGGYGIFYQTLGNGGCGCRTGFANPINLASDGRNGAVQWDGGIPTPPGFRPPPLLDQAPFVFSPTTSGAAVDVFSDNFGLAPRVHNWNFSIQQEIGKFVIEAGYVGNRGRRLNSTVMLNQLPVNQLALGSLLQRPISSPEVVAAGFKKPYASFPDNQSLAQALRPYPQYLDVSERNAGIGRTWYDSLQVKGERRFGDFQMLASYTWSKSLGLAHYRQIFSQNFLTNNYSVAAQDNYNYNDQKSYLPFDQPYVLNILATYALPLGKGKKFMNTDNFLANLALGGWTISGSQQYRSGVLILAQAPNTLGNGVLFTGFKKANLAPGAAVRTGVDKQSLDPNDPNSRFFNTNAYSLPGQFELGTAAQYHNELRQPAVFEENLSIAKRMKFPIGGERSIDLLYRADAFNIFNRTNFGVSQAQAIGNANFGRPTGPQSGARLITMGLRLEF